MWNDRPKHYDKPEKADGEGWLYSEQELEALSFQAGCSNRSRSMGSRQDLSVRSASSSLIWIS